MRDITRVTVIGGEESYSDKIVKYHISSHYIAKII